MLFLYILNIYILLGTTFAIWARWGFDNAELTDGVDLLLDIGLWPVGLWLYFTMRW